MNRTTRRVDIPGPAGAIECAVDDAPGASRGTVVLCHPHPLFGGTMDNKVVQTMARAFVQLGYRALRFNFRGVGASGGTWDEGRGEVDDALAVIADPLADTGGERVLAGFSFGAYVAAAAAARIGPERAVRRLALVGPAVQNFTVPRVPEDTLVVHGEHDDVVPLAAVLDWARPQSLPVTVVPGGGHFFHGQLPLLKQIIQRAWH